MQAEHILCAAIYFDDQAVRAHQPTNIEKGIVVCGHRHHNCYTVVAELNLPAEVLHRAIQGFLTSTNRFVNRKLAALIAYDAKQIDKPTTMLISEDLY